MREFLAVIQWGTGYVQIDFSSGVGDTDRSITFTAPVTGYYYLEVSSYPGNASPYHLTSTSD